MWTKRTTSKMNIQRNFDSINVKLNVTKLIYFDYLRPVISAIPARSYFVQVRFGATQALKRLDSTWRNSGVC